VADSKPSPKDLYDAVRDQIRHEDELVNHRFGWFLAAQAFLLAGFGAALPLYDTFQRVSLAWLFLTVGLLGLGVLGIVLSVITSRPIRWAYTQSNHVANWWTELEGNPAGQFPRIQFPEPKGGWPLLRTATAPLCFAWAWGLMMGLLLIAVLAYRCAHASG
jgi:hypothetical protein